MTAKEEDKYLVLKREDLDNYFSQYTKETFTNAEEQAVIEQVPFFEVINGLNNKNKYIVCNQDEPYAELVWQIILLGEDAKLHHLSMLAQKEKK